MWAAGWRKTLGVTLPAADGNGSSLARVDRAKVLESARASEAELAGALALFDNTAVPNRLVFERHGVGYIALISPLHCGADDDIKVLVLPIEDKQSKVPGGRSRCRRKR